MVSVRPPLLAHQLLGHVAAVPTDRRRNLTYARWLRESNESADLRQAFELLDAMPTTLGLDTRLAMLLAVKAEAEVRWAATKAALVDGRETAE